jgi:hypothetical protein
VKARERGQRQAGAVGRIEKHQIEALRRRAEPCGIARQQADKRRCADAREVGPGQPQRVGVALDHQHLDGAARAGLDADGSRAAEQIQKAGAA